MVGSKDAFYKSIGHKYKLNFMTSTMVFKVTAPEIPRYHFDFVPFSEILNATDESRLVDVIGHVVEKGVVKETIANGKKSKVTNLTLKDLETCDIEAALGWYYQSCTVCSTKVTIIDDIISCDRCGEPRTAVPRYKVHLQVIDNSGSTTFTLFDRVVSRVLDEEIIERFMSHHALNGVDGDNVEAGCVELGSQAAYTNDVVEGSDSTKDDKNTLATPTSKNSGKRSIDSVESISNKDVDGSA
ncbi:replication protein A 70 kDa DNA-binding subunit [Trifolium repens]|nr:replication protein A 70 kDa DNA-binding subunit [Trifolium repens]